MPMYIVSVVETVDSAAEFDCMKSLEDSSYKGIYNQRNKDNIYIDCVVWNEEKQQTIRFSKTITMKRMLLKQTK